MWRITIEEWKEKPANEDGESEIRSKLTEDRVSLVMFGITTKVIEEYLAKDNDEAIKVWHEQRNSQINDGNRLILYRGKSKVCYLIHLFGSKTDNINEHVPIDKDIKHYLEIMTPWEKRSPNDELISWSKEMSPIWRMAQLMYLNKQFWNAEYSKIPNYCFLPMKEWYKINDEINNQDKVLPKLSRIASLGTWRYSQGIYKYNDNIYSELIKTEFKGKLPSEFLLRLPEWCVYIETPYGLYDYYNEDNKIYGFFAFLDFSEDITTLYIDKITFTDNGEHPITICIGDWDIAEGIEKGLIKGHKNEHNEEPNWFGETEEEKALNISDGVEEISPYLSLLLYLCSTEPEIKGTIPNEYPKYYTPKKVKGGYKLFPPDKPKIWKVGEVTGEMLRAAIEKENSEEKKNKKTQEKRRSHIRRGHWHGFWSGPKKPPAGIEPESFKRNFDLKWLHPMLVTGFDKSNIDEIDAIEGDDK